MTVAVIQCNDHLEPVLLRTLCSAQWVCGTLRLVLDIANARRGRPLGLDAEYPPPPPLVIAEGSKARGQQAPPQANRANHQGLVPPPLPH